MFSELGPVFSQIKASPYANFDEFLLQLMKVLIEHYPTEAYSKFEEVSYLLRHKHLKMGDYLVL